MFRLIANAVSGRTGKFNQTVSPAIKDMYGHVVPLSASHSAEVEKAYHVGLISTALTLQWVFLDAPLRFSLEVVTPARARRLCGLIVAYVVCALTGGSGAKKILSTGCCDKSMWDQVAAASTASSPGGRAFGLYRLILAEVGGGEMNPADAMSFYSRLIDFIGGARAEIGWPYSAGRDR